MYTGASQINVEYWFLWIYNLFYGSHVGSVRYSELSAFLSSLWLWIIVVGYVLAIAALFLIVYLTVRLYELRQREHAFYNTLLVPAGQGAKNPRWEHVQTLIGSSNPSDWRTAIIEADIMLDDALTRQGYVGDGVGEKLKNVPAGAFGTLNDAWEAHKVRNQIAHEGSSFDLSPTLVQRTIARYEAVFREFDLI